MKYFLTLIFLILSGCTPPNLIQPEVSRSQLYYGQTVANLYNNFGAPKKAEIYAHNVILYTFSQEEIITPQTAATVDKGFKYCDLRVYTQNERVIDWEWQGNNCRFKSQKVWWMLDQNQT